MIVTGSELRTTLHQRLRSFEIELAEWLDLSNRAEWSRHQSQIHRLHGLFSACTAALGKDIDLLGDDGGEELLAPAKRLGRKILQAHTFWSYYREKLVQRSTAGPARYLAAADEFAWRCFKPCMLERAASLAAQGGAVASKSPPLVYLGPAVSPFVVPRSFQLEIPGVSEELFKPLLLHAPLSVVSLPFYQTTHLPDTMVLGHEMGHVMEFDLELGKELDEKVAAIAYERLPAEQLAYWRTCRVEAFADAFGTLVGGSAFFLSMGQFLAKEKTAISSEWMRPKSGNRGYPTVYLRVLLCHEVLKQNGAGVVPARARDFMTKWRAAYGDHTYAAYEDDLPRVAEALVGTSLAGLGGKTLRQAVAGMDAAAEEDLDRDVTNAFRSTRFKSSDPRMLFAVATAAYYENRSQYLTANVEERVIDVIRDLADDAPRSTHSITREQSEADLQFGLDLIGKLGDTGPGFGG